MRTLNYWPRTIRPTAKQRKLRGFKIQQRGDMVRAVAKLSDGETIVRQIRAHAPTLAGDELGGRFLRKMKRGLKKVGKGALVPLKFAHKITHKGPIGKLERAAQKFIGKNLPIAKPFINIHNKLASPVHKALSGKKIKAKVTAQGIAAATQHLPIKAKKAAQTALAAKFAQKAALENVAKAVVKQKVLTAAAKAVKKSGGKNKLAARVLARANAKGVFEVRTPSGRIIKVPASKVA